MEIDEEALTGFFGAAPESGSEEEQAFFGSLTWRVREAPYLLTVGFGRNFGDASFHLALEGRDEPLLQSLLSEIRAVEVSADPAVLTVRGTARDAAGADPGVVVRATLTLAPLSLRLEDGIG